MNDDSHKRDSSISPSPTTIPQEANDDNDTHTTALDEIIFPPPPPPSLIQRKPHRSQHHRRTTFVEDGAKTDAKSKSKHQEQKETFQSKITRLKSTVTAPSTTNWTGWPKSHGASSKKSVSRASKMSKQSFDVVLAQDINSDYDLTYGRPKALRGYYFNLEWWWLKFSQSGTHRTLVLLSAFLITLGIAHLIFALFLLTANTQVGDPYLCRTEGCIRAAERIAETMKLTSATTTTSAAADIQKAACTDFYSFVCGDLLIDDDDNTEEQNITQNTKLKFQTYERAAVRIDTLNYDFLHSRSLGKMLRDDAQHKEKYGKPLKFYKSCLDRKRRNGAGLQPLIQLFRQYDLFSIIVHDSQSVTLSIGTVLAKVYKDMILSIPLFNFNLYRDTKEYEITRSTYPAIKSIFLYDMATYRGTMRSILKYVGEQIPELNLSTNQTQLDALEKELICTELALFHYYGTERQKLETELNCQIYFNLLSDTKEKEIADGEYKRFFVELLADDIPDIGEWTEVNKVLGLASPTSIHRKYLDQAMSVNYRQTLRLLQWRILSEYAGNLDDVMFDLQCPINRVQQKCTRVIACFWSMFESFPQEATIGFINSIKKRPNAFAELRFMINSIVESGVQLSKSILRPTVNHLATTQLHFNELLSEAFNVSVVQTSVHEQVGDAGAEMKPELELYEKIIVGPNYFENILRFREHQGRMNVLRHMHLGEGVEISRLNELKPQIDLYTHDLENNILAVPLGGVEEPLFQSTFPALDLSGLGYSVASAISRLVFLEQFIRHGHSFRLENAKEVTWLESLDEDELLWVWQAYENSLKTLVVDLLTKLPQTNWELNGQIFEGNSSSLVFKKTLKILSDSFALKVAYKVHDSYLQRSTRFFNQKLHGLDQFTSRQIFFINLVSLKCKKYSRPMLADMLKDGSIPLPMSTNIILTNSEEFAETFNCPLNTPMNAFTKINLYH